METCLQGPRSMGTSHRMLNVHHASIVIVGDACVGKTSLVKMFHSDGRTYPKDYMMTIGVEFSTKQVKLPETDTIIIFYILDCSGQDIFNKMEQNSMHWKDPTALICLVYDISSRESFEACRKWLRGIRAARKSKTRVHGVLVANKADLRSETYIGDVVGIEEGQSYACENGLEFFEVSAATGDGVDQTFKYLAKEYKRMHEEYNNKNQKD